MDTRKGARASVGAGPSGQFTVACASASMAVSMLPLMLIGAMAIPLRAGAGVTLADLGVAVAAFYAASALTSIPGGRLADGRSLTLALMGGTTLSAAAHFGMASSHAVGFVLVAMAVAGIGNGIAQPATNVLVARRTGARRGMALGIKQAATPAAGLLAGASAPAVAAGLGWRTAYVMAGMLSLALLMPLRSFRSVPVEGGTARRAEVARYPASLLLLAALCTLALASAGSLTVFWVSDGVDRGLSLATAGLWLSFASVLSVGARLTVGWWSDRRPSLIVPTMTIILLTAASATFLLASSRSVIVGLVAMPLAAAASAAWNPPLLYLVLREYVDYPATAAGVLNTGAFVGGMIGPSVIGFVADRVSWTAAWTTAGCIWLAAVALLTVAARLRRRSSSKVTASSSP